jgi:hypothetical protein
LRAIRRNLVVRFVAACLVVLGATPFTAPFAVFDLADLNAPASTADPLSDVKPIKDAAAVVVVAPAADASVEWLPVWQVAHALTAPAFVRALVLRI